MYYKLVLISIILDLCDIQASLIYHMKDKVILFLSNVLIQHLIFFSIKSLLLTVLTCDIFVFRVVFEYISLFIFIMILSWEVFNWPTNKLCGEGKLYRLSMMLVLMLRCRTTAYFSTWALFYVQVAWSSAR